ncbi:hypothetical protein [Texcoconibacillus texcoconensis]|uniref:SHOCT domain-containing protein n=1 Tax=Texcoconibacillus texcoconensis TaxID=1095777 RepID=A0A840QU54_9BACI|nr:hypothetical protein [Texcoconibacillus texcoconensis]MBB5174797.1 hypothetical protein [Texcoconibacillus texcoconensis]
MILTYQKWLIASVVAIFSLTILQVNAVLGNEQESLIYEDLNVQVMPEYALPDGWDEERPNMLIGHHAILTNEGDSEFQEELSIHAPVDNPDFFPAFVGEYDDEDQLAAVEFTIDEKNEEIVWTPEQTIHPGETYQYVIEYYYYPFEIEDQTSYSFTFETNYPTKEATVAIYTPYGAENVEINHESDEQSEMMMVPVDGYRFSDLPVGEHEYFEVSYEKEDPITTIDALAKYEAPDDDMHAMFQNDLDNDTELGPTATMISTENSILISVSFVVAGSLFYLGMRQKYRAPQQSNHTNAKTKKGRIKEVDQEGEKQKLKQQFLDGEIDEETYRKKRSALS